MIALRRLTAADLPAAHALSAGFNWPHRPEDWSLLLRLGRGMVAERDGTVLGTAMGWAHGPAHASIGMIIVARDAQGQGVGRRLTSAVLDDLPGCSVLLHATPAGETLYRSLGFVPEGSIHQHQSGDFQADAPLAGPPLAGVRPAAPGDGAAIAALDRVASGMRRDVLIAALLGEAEAVVLDRDGAPAGFALLRRFGRGRAIGPVVAPDAAAAKALITHLLAANPAGFIRIDVTAGSGLSPWLATLGLPAVDTVTRMVRGAPVAAGDGAAVFALASQALG